MQLQLSISMQQKPRLRDEKKKWNEIVQVLELLIRYATMAVNTSKNRNTESAALKISDEKTFFSASFLYLHTAFRI